MTRPPGAAASGEGAGAVVPVIEPARSRNKNSLQCDRVGAMRRLAGRLCLDSMYPDPASLSETALELRLGPIHAAAHQGHATEKIPL